MITLENKQTKNAFCAQCQEETDHTVEVDHNGEILMTCECGRFQKFASGMTAKAVNDDLGRRKKASSGLAFIEDMTETMDNL